MRGVSLKIFAENFGLNIHNQECVKGFAVDSRKVQPGFVFFALAGSNVDGHSFVDAAIQNGAIACVVDKDYTPYGDKVLIIKVGNALTALQTLARDFLTRQSKKVVAITGSVGKTTTKEFCCTLLKSKYRVFKTPGNANSQVGLPLSILNHGDFHEDVLVFEMGMSGYNQIQSLVRIAPPDVAVITKIAPAHMEYFQKGLEGIAEAKSEILGHPKTQLAILNKQVMDFEVFRGFKDRKFVHYSITDPTNVDYFLKKQGDSLHLYCESEEKVILAPFEESHFLENLLAAIAVARSFEVPWSAIFSSLKNLQSLEGRFERIEKGGVLFINDSYNANPESMKAALGSLPVPQKGSKRVAVLGCMVELGPQSDRYHYDIGLFASTCVDQLFCYGQNSLAIKEGFDQSGRPSMIFDSLIELHMFLKQNVSSGDVVLLKASNSVNLWNLMDM